MEHRYFGHTDRRDLETDENDTENAVREALRPLASAVGLDDIALEQAVERDLSRQMAKAAFDALEHTGLALADACVLDLGAGLGQASVEGIVRGCRLVAIEPGVEWCSVARRRLKEVGSGDAVVADGEQLPFEADQFDAIVSVGVLEHVRRPERFLKEAYRVLKPGGCMFLSFENYLSFYEPHYQLNWLPLFPKRLAAFYLRVRGRSADFLMTSIFYTTRLGALRLLRTVGFHFAQEKRLIWVLSRRFQKLEATTQGSFDNLARFGARVTFWLRNLRAAFSPFVTVVVEKPADSLPRGTPDPDH